jgi:hypothetical protein
VTAQRERLVFFFFFLAAGLGAGGLLATGRLRARVGERVVALRLRPGRALLPPPSASSSAMSVAAASSSLRPRLLGLRALRHRARIDTQRDHRQLQLQLQLRALTAGHPRKREPGTECTVRGGIATNLWTIRLINDDRFVIELSKYVPAGTRPVRELLHVGLE